MMAVRRERRTSEAASGLGISLLFEYHFQCMGGGGGEFWIFTA